MSSNTLQNVTPILAAIDPRAADAMLYLHPKNIGGHSLVELRPDQRGNESIQVRCETLAAALTLLPGGRCECLKLDCEGAEWKIQRSLTAEQASRIERIVYEPIGWLYSISELN